MSFRTPLKSNIFQQSLQSQNSNSNSSTRLSSIKKVLNSDKEQGDSFKKNRSVTFQNSLSNVNIKHFNHEGSQTQNQSKFFMKNQDQNSNENFNINYVIQDIVQNASDQKYSIYQNQISRQKQPQPNLFQTQNYFAKKRQHCSNDMACSKKHIEQSRTQIIEKPSKRELDEYNYQQTQKMILQDQGKNEINIFKQMQTLEKSVIKGQEENREQNVSEEQIQQKLLESARAINSRTFLKIQANMKPHPVLISYCLSFIYIYRDYLQISDCKLKKLENNWREIQAVFQHHSPLIQALDSIGTQIKQQRIHQENINKSKEQIQKTEFIVDSIKNTSMYSDIVIPIQNFLKQCDNAINFYNRKYKLSANQVQQNERLSSDIENKNKKHQILKTNQKNSQPSLNSQTDQQRRNTYANINQSQESGEVQTEDELTEFTLDLSPIQQKHSNRQIHQISLTKQINQQSQNLNMEEIEKIKEELWKV